MVDKGKPNLNELPNFNIAGNLKKWEIPVKNSNRIEERRIEVQQMNQRKL